MEKEAFSVSELADIGLPGLPKTPRALLDLVKVEGWSFVEAKSVGRGGVRREFTPPPALLALIRKHLRGEAVTEEEVRRARAVRPGAVILDEAHLARGACSDRIKEALRSVPPSKIATTATPAAPLVDGVPFHGAPADLDVVLFEKVLRAVDEVLDPTGSDMSIEEEGYIVRALYAHFLPRRAKITEVEIANYIRFCITNAPSQSA